MKGFLQLKQQSGQIAYVGHGWMVVPGSETVCTLYIQGGHITINQSASDLANQLNDFFTREDDIGKAQHKAA